jgi:hypothetical protein
VFLPVALLAVELVGQVFLGTWVAFLLAWLNYSVAWLVRPPLDSVGGTLAVWAAVKALAPLELALAGVVVSLVMKFQLVADYWPAAFPLEHSPNQKVWVYWVVLVAEAQVAWELEG